MIATLGKQLSAHHDLSVLHALLGQTRHVRRRDLHHPLARWRAGGKQGSIVVAPFLK